MRLMLLILSLDLLLSGCATNLVAPDVIACHKFGRRIELDIKTKRTMMKPSPTCMKMIGEEECLHCTYTISKKEVYIGQDRKNFFNDKSMIQIINESVLVPSEESYTPISEYIINSSREN